MNSSGGSKVVQFKLVLLGDSAVGKSSLVLRFVRGQFFEYQESTIGAAFLTQVRRHPFLHSPADEPRRTLRHPALVTKWRPTKPRRVTHSIPQHGIMQPCNHVTM